MKAYFCRKASDLQELTEMTRELLEMKVKSQEYIVTKEITLKSNDFEIFTSDFYDDQIWITEEDGGIFDNVVHCIRVVNQDTNEVVLVNSEGYSYPRYTAIEL